MWFSKVNVNWKTLTFLRPFVTVEPFKSVSKGKMALRSLNDLPEDEFRTFCNSFDTVLTDCDGVLWLGDELIAGSREVMNRFKQLGKNTYFVTNNSTKTREEFVTKFNKLGFNATVDDVISTAYLAALYIKNLNLDIGKKVYIVGSKGISQELDKFGIKHIGVGPDVLTSDVPSLLRSFNAESNAIGAVVVGFDEHFSFPKMLKAATFLNNPSVHFIATNTDERFPSAHSAVIPGTGSFISAIKTCSEREPVVVGKPEAYVGEAIIKNNGLNPARTLMIGDRCNTDILLGTRCGFQTLLVLTGVTALSEVSKWKEEEDQSKSGWVPDYYLNKLGDIINRI